MLKDYRPALEKMSMDNAHMKINIKQMKTRLYIIVIQTPRNYSEPILPPRFRLRSHSIKLVNLVYRYKEINMELLDTKEKALQWLYQDEFLNLMSIDMLETDCVDIEFSGTQSLLLANDSNYMIHCKNEDEWPHLIEKLLEIIATDRFVILRAHEKWYLDDLMEKSGFTDLEVYFNSIYPDSLSLENQVPEDVTIRPLPMAEFSSVREIYLTVDSDEYITKRIQEGMLGAFANEELAGFIGTHENRAIGLLEVLPKFRRKGIGRALETQMVKRLWSLNRRAFGNIAQDNALSRTVHEKIGLPISKEPVYWLFPPEY